MSLLGFTSKQTVECCSLQMIVRNPRRPHIPDPIDFHVLPTIIFQVICRLIALLLRIPENDVPSLHKEKKIISMPFTREPMGRPTTVKQEKKDRQNTDHPQAHVNTRRQIRVLIQRHAFTPLSELRNVTRHNLGLLRCRPRGLMMRRVCDVTEGEDVREGRICELERAFNGDEAGWGRCDRLRGEGGKNGGVRSLAGCDDLWNIQNYCEFRESVNQGWRKTYDKVG